MGAAIWLVLIIVGVAVYQNSDAGLRLRASREDEVSARSVGVNVLRERCLAFVVSGFVVGVGGGLYAQTLGVVTPDQFFLTPTFLTIAMLVIGGMTSLSGAVIGALSVAGLAELLRTIERTSSSAGTPVTGLADLGLAIALIATIIWRPGGLTGGRELRLHRPGRMG